MNDERQYNLAGFIVLSWIFCSLIIIQKKQGWIHPRQFINWMLLALYNLSDLFQYKTNLPSR